MCDDIKGFHVATLDRTTPEGKKAKEILEYSIPEDERVDMDLLRSMLPKTYELVEWCLMDSDRAIGYCSFIRSPKAILGLYLAIDSELRGKGYGTKVLEMMFRGPARDPLRFSAWKRLTMPRRTINRDWQGSDSTNVSGSACQTSR